MSVALVAAGPGDPGLWTVRVEQLLATATLVVCDAELVADVAPLAPAATVVTVAGPDEAAAVLVARAGEGAAVRVARGDRLVWEAGGIEAAALRAAGIGATVVPAVTVAFAGPAAEGIPVMSRALAATLTVAVGVPAPADVGGTVVTLADAGATTATVTGAVAGLRLGGPDGIGHPT